MTEEDVEVALGDEVTNDDLSDYDSNEFLAPQVSTARMVFDDQGKVKIEDGMIFDDVDHFRNELKEFAIQEGFQLLRLKNERTRVIYVCAEDGCEWRIHASPTEDKVTFIIKSFNPRHTCSRRKDRNLDATSKWIAKKLGPQLKADPELSTKSIRAILWKKYKIEPSYRQIWKARVIAKETNEGNHAKSYAKIPKYGEMIRQINPSSVFKLQFISRDNMSANLVFKRCFICYEACKVGVFNGCTPFIGLDGCHLKEKYGGILLSIVFIDGNNGLFPLAFAVVESKYKQKGLTEAVQEVFSDSNTRHYCRHLYANFRSKFARDKLRSLFWAPSRAYREIKFKEALSEIKSIRNDAHDWLSANPPNSWSRWAFDHRAKSNHITNNMTESFNNCIVPYRDKPILYLIDQLRILLMEKLHKRFEQACSYKGSLTPNIKKKLDVIYQQSRSCVALSAGYNEFEVNDGALRFVVNLNTRKCGCQVWEATGLPCKHVTCCMAYKRERVKDHCDSFYSLGKYIQAYENMIHPLPNISELEDTSVMGVNQNIVGTQTNVNVSQRTRLHNEAMDQMDSVQARRRAGMTATHARRHEKEAMKLQIKD
ncbi:uncharacterized protein LOC122063048 [Macadamia integrifolia]|uniref:uncharacterized protein LOC122063048 n=1 Tax=Macadamia integrifolia TaxID=60698 RepID=UPI001C4F55CF|nr:uncharacterized protein LOC122063048 [Macadamia integrifolia]